MLVLIENDQIVMNASQAFDTANMAYRRNAPNFCVWLLTEIALQSGTVADTSRQASEIKTPIVFPFSNILLNALQQAEQPSREMRVMFKGNDDDLMGVKQPSKQKESHTGIHSVT